MYIHKEGRTMLFWLGIIFGGIIALMAFAVHPWNLFHYLVASVFVLIWFAFASFFRIPKRDFIQDENVMMAPADGTVCVIEETCEEEYIKGSCLQISIFMYGTDVHVNRYPVSGKVEYVCYHRGNYFNASYPKSSVLNEHSSVGMVTSSGERILIKQIAGVMARRICCYAKEGEVVQQNQELGFIKFGSRVDLFVPLGTEVFATLKEQVFNGITKLCSAKPSL
ncbi:MAG: phosphatidylserine decarboxylase family protein [Bacteroidales bacterium]|nr:phosphatidylserine decarboxylase family protein [Bacteroidales bacterium]